ncbi:MAG TPA: HEAT repeat domain-containing protein [Tepidisphaeraceae bacterium]|nr:HEAT repeat domain-containing protein [Tepidisphaeraceae bacterium]
MRLHMGPILGLLLAMTAAHGQQRSSTGPADRLGFGIDHLDIAEAVEVIEVPPRTVTMLGESMIRERGTRRVGLARDLGACRSPAALPFLRQVLTDADPSLRAQAVRSAGEIGDVSIVADLRPLLRDPAAAVRREAVLACAALADTDPAAAALDDPDPAVVAAAVEAVRDGDALAGQLNGLPPAVKPQAIRRLAELGASGHAEFIATFLTEDIAAKIAAVEALARLDAAAHAAAMVTLLEDAHPAVRRAATAALTLVDGAQRSALAIRMLRDPAAEVRQAAAEVLARQPHPDALDPLVAQLDDGDEPLRIAARAALVAMGDVSIEPAAKLLAHTDPARRVDGSHMLGHLRSDAALDAHLALLKDSKWEVVAQAAWALGRIGRPEAREPIGDIVQGIPATAGLLPREQQAALSEAVVAAARLGVQSATVPMARLIIELSPTPQRPPAPRLRAAAIWGFGILSDRADKALCDALASIVDEVLEQRPPKVEAIKALGHLRCTSAADALRRLAQSSLDPHVRWLACWAYQRVTGEPIAYAPPIHTHTPQLSIMPLAQ